MQSDSWNLDTAEKIKVIKLLIHEKLDNVSIVDYLSGISDLMFSTHASEMRYGETYYFRGTGKNVKAILVPTLALSALPRKYRKNNWFFVQIYCHPDDARFDTFPNYEITSADQYNL